MKIESDTWKSICTLDRKIQHHWCSRGGDVGGHISFMALHQVLRLHLCNLHMCKCRDRNNKWDQ